MSERLSKTELVQQETDRIELLCECAQLELATCTADKHYSEEDKIRFFESLLSYYSDIEESINKLELLCCEDEKVLDCVDVMRDQLLSADDIKSIIDQWTN